MARNVEIKARLRDPDGIRKHLDALRASGPQHLSQTDTFFNVPSGRLKLRDFGDGTGELIAYERTDTAGPKLSSYHRAPTATPSELLDVLARALGTRGIVRKQRAVYLVGQTRVHLDEVDGLGTFVELEVVLRDDQTVADGDAVANDLLQQLRIDAQDLVTHAYIDLLTGASASRSHPPTRR